MQLEKKLEKNENVHNPNDFHEPNVETKRIHEIIPPNHLRKEQNLIPSTISTFFLTVINFVTKLNCDTSFFPGNGLSPPTSPIGCPLTSPPAPWEGVF